MQTTLSSVPILGLLTWGPMSGYDIKQKIEESLGNFWSESYGQIYPRLRELESDGLISKIAQEGKSARGKKTFALTESGRKRLREWLFEVPSARPPRNELLLKIFIAQAGYPAVIRGHIEADRREAEIKLARYENIKSRLNDMGDGDPRAKYWIMTVNYGISKTRAFLEWADDTISQFEDETRPTKKRRAIHAD